MKDFIFQYYIDLVLFVEILAAVTGLILYKKYSQTIAKYFILFLWYVVLLSTVGRYTLYIDDGFLYFLKGTIFERNYWLYTIMWKICAVIFFSCYFQRILKSIVNITILKYSTYVFLGISVFTILTNLDFFFKGSFPIIYICGGIIILQCAFFYFFEILQSDEILNFHKSLNFYIACAILFFWLIKTPLVFYEIYYTKADLNYVLLRSYINIAVIFTMYLTFTVGLIVSKPELRMKT